MKNWIKFWVLGGLLLLAGIATLAQQSAVNFSQIMNIKTLNLGNAIENFSYSSDGKVLVMAEYRSFSFWDVSSGKKISSFRHGGTYTWDVDYNPNGRTIAIAQDDGLVIIFDVSSGNEVRRFSGHSGQVLSVAFSPDGKFVASGGYDRISRIWEISTGREINRFSENNSIRSLAFSPEGKKLVTSTFTGDLTMWDTITGSKLISFIIGSGALISDAEFSPDGSTMASGGVAGVDLWDVSNGAKLRSFPHPTTVGGLAFSPDGLLLVTGVADQTARIWDVSSGNQLKILRGHSSQVRDVEFSADGLTLATAGSQDETVRLWGNPDLKPAFDTRIQSIGTLQIKAPESASIRINDQTGTSNQQLLAGTYTVTVTLAGFKPFTQTVSVTQNQTTTVTANLERLMGTIQLNSNPSGAIVSQNGTQYGTTPYEVKAPIGVYGLTLSQNGYESQSIKLEVRTDETTRQTVNLKALPVAIKINSNVANSVANVNGTNYPIPSGGLSVQVPVGDNKITVSAANYNSQTQTISVAPAAPVTVDFALERHMGTVVVSSPFVGARVSINGEEKGVISGNGLFEVQVPTGSVRVDVSANGFVTFSQSVNVSNNARVTVTANLVALIIPKPIITILSTRAENGQVLIDVLANIPVDTLKFLVYLDGREAPILEARSLVTEGNGNGTRVTLRIALPTDLPNGDIRVRVIATNSTNVNSDPASDSFRNGSSVGNSVAPPSSPNPTPPNQNPTPPANNSADSKILYVLAVGINKYKSTNITPLKFAVKDATDFSNIWLSQKNKLYDDVRLRLLTDEDATRDRVQDELDRITRLADANDRVVLFFAGHGINDKINNTTRYVIVTHETDPDRPSSTGFEQAKLREFIAATKAQTMIFLDTCNAGAISDVRGDGSISTTDTIRGNLASAPVAGATPKPLILSATTGNNFAFENAAWGNGAFTKAMIEALQDGKAANSRGVVTWLRFVDYVGERVAELTSGKQVPAFEQTGTNFDLFQTK